MISLWDKFKLEEKIIKILSEVKKKNDTPHFGNVFLSSYQIAIEFAKKYPKDFKEIGLQIGGEGIGEQNSIAQRFALQLSKKIKEQKDYPIEGRFLSCNKLNELTYKNKGEVITPSNMRSNDHSIFRLKDCCGYVYSRISE